MHDSLERTISSLEVAEMVDRDHKEVLRNIRTICSHLGERKIAQSYFIESTYLSSQNKEHPCFMLTKKGCELFSTRMTGTKGTRFAVAYIEKFNEMEAVIKKEQKSSDKIDIMIATLENMKEVKQDVLEVKTDVEILKNEINLTRLQKKQLSQKVKANVVRALGGKRNKAYGLYAKVAFSEHWNAIRNYFGVASYEEIPRLQFEEAMELADEWTPSAGLRLDINKLSRCIDEEFKD